MPSTYTLNNGIELIATGEQSGTWGDTTNVNLGLIDTALDGQVTITLPAAGSSGSPNALAISDGSASNGRNRLVIFDDGGDLGATAFVQLTPNDAEKIVYIRNNLSGGRAITLFQGTYNASNDYEVPAGTTAVVFFNGGGAGAVAANVFNNAFFDSLRLGGVSVTAILDEDNMASDSATALATQQSIKAYVDAQVGANNELSEVLANGNTSGGTNIQMTTTDEVQFRDTALTINSSVDGQLDIAADVELEIVAPTLDINASTAVTIDTTTMTMTGSVNVVGDLDVDNLNINGNSIISTNTDGNIALTPNGTGEVDISKVDIDGGTIDGTVIGGSTPAAITGTTGAFSSSGFPVVINSTNNNLFKLALQDTAATVGYIGASSAAAFAVGSSAAAELFRVSSTGDVGIGTSSITSLGTNVRTLQLNDVQGSGIRFAANGINYSYIFGGSTTLDIATGTTIPMTFATNATERMRITSTGDVGIGTVSPSARLHVAGGSARFVSGGSGGIFGDDNTSYFIVQASPTANAAAIYFNGQARSGFESQLHYGASNHVFYNESLSAERLRITSTGLVGIGTAAPDGPLTVQLAASSATSWSMAVEGANTAQLSHIITDNTSVRRKLSAIESFVGSNDVSNFQGGLIFKTTPAAGSPTERMRITAAGDVGIGTSSPSQKLQVIGNIVSQYSGNDSAMYLSCDGTTSRLISTYSSTGSYLPLTFLTGGSERMRIDASGTLGLGVTPSAWNTAFDGRFQFGVQGVLASTSTSSQIGLNWYYDGAYRYIGTGEASRFYQVDGTFVFENAASGTAGNAITFAERMRIDASGNVGIGASSLLSTFEISAGANNTYMRINDTRASVPYVGSESGALVFGLWGVSERMRIDASGNLLVGTTTAGLSRIYAPATGNLHGIRGSAATAGYVGIYGEHLVNSSTSYVAYFFNTGSSTGLYMSNTAAWQSISDARMKEDVRDLDTTERLMQLRPVDYLWKHQATSDEPDRRNLGFIAQEVQQVFPELVSTSPNGMFGVEYTGLIAPLVKASKPLRLV
jgi:trimeric autotransporter adhesin